MRGKYHTTPTFNDSDSSYETNYTELCIVQLCTVLSEMGKLKH